MRLHNPIIGNICILINVSTLMLLNASFFHGIDLSYLGSGKDLR